MNPGQNVLDGLCQGRARNGNIRVVYANGRSAERRGMETFSLAQVIPKPEEPA